MLKTFFQILVFILALVYIGGRVGILSTQLRNAKKNKFALPAPKSNLPDSIWVAQQYVKTISCDTLGEVQIELQLKDRVSGWMRTIHAREGAGPACKFKIGFNIKFEQDHITVKYPPGNLDGEARCPIKCRYTTFLRTKFATNYLDTIIDSKPYQVLQFPGFTIGAL